MVMPQCQGLRLPSVYPLELLVFLLRFVFALCTPRLHAVHDGLPGRAPHLALRIVAAHGAPSARGGERGLVQESKGIPCHSFLCG